MMVPGRLVEVVEPGRMIESSPDELIEEIRRKAGKRSLSSIMCVTGAILPLLGLLGLMAEEKRPIVPGMLIGGGFVALMSLPWTIWWDRRSLRTRVNYDFDTLGSKVHEAIMRLLEGIQRADDVWSIRVEDNHGDWKRNAGAGVSVDRKSVRVGWSAPPRFLTNVRVGNMLVSESTLYFLPDRLLIFGSGGIQAVSYVELNLESDTVDFVEQAEVPRDAARVGTTWKFVKRDGGPDLRFRDNRQLAVMRYGVLNLSSPSGLRLKLHLSTTGLAAGSVALFDLVKSAIEDLRSRGIPLRPGSGPHGIEDAELPPLGASALKAARIGAATLNYRWLAWLPEWAVPIVWGSIFALPLVAGIILIAQGSTTSAWIVLCVSLFMAGCGIPVLARDRKRLLSMRAAEDAKRRKDQFRDLLKGAFRSQPAGRVRIEPLADEAAVTRDEMESVTDELYRKMAERAVADGVVTSEERRILRTLAKSLQIDSERSNRLEIEVASARYHRAVVDAQADGIVTAEETRMLNEMRANLGIEEAEWAGGDPRLRE